MFDFSDIRTSTKAEQVRAWSVERALMLGGTDNIEDVVYRAAEIEKFVLEGKKKDENA